MHLGRLAQLGEHLPYKQGVTGSIPVTSILICAVLTRYLLLIVGGVGTYLYIRKLNVLLGQPKEMIIWYTSIYEWFKTLCERGALWRKRAQ